MLDRTIFFSRDEACKSPFGAVTPLTKVTFTLRPHIWEGFTACTLLTYGEFANSCLETDLPKATLLRFLGTLSALGYVCRDDADRYSLTLKLFSISSRALQHSDLIAKARPFAQQLCQSLGETVHMGILEGDRAVYVLKEESSYTLRMYSRIGKTIPLYCTAIGKIFLSQMGEDELKTYLGSHVLKPYTTHTVGSVEALRDQLELIRRRGWSIDDQEHEDSVMCLASPIRDYTGQVVAAMSVSWPIFRFNQADFEKIVCEITSATDQLSAIMGWERS